MTQRKVTRRTRRLCIVLGVLGAVLTLASVAMAMLGDTLATILPWLAPEGAGLALLLLGLHAWIDWRER